MAKRLYLHCGCGHSTSTHPVPPELVGAFMALLKRFASYWQGAPFVELRDDSDQEARHEG